MRYADSPALDAVYDLVATLYEVDDQPERAMTIAAALLEGGEERSWAAVWWAYGAIHHDLSDEAYARALELLPHVDAMPAARAAALMLQAEIEYTSAVEHGGDPDPARQVELLVEAVGLAPEWPSLHQRVARALHAAGDDERAREHARRAVEARPPTGDPFESAISGESHDRGYVAEELASLGLLQS